MRVDIVGVRVGGERECARRNDVGDSVVWVVVIVRVAVRLAVYEFQRFSNIRI